LASPCCGHQEVRARGAGSRFNTATQGSIAASARTWNASELHGQIFVRSALTIALAIPTAAGHSQSMDELYSAAKKEGALAVNGGGPAGLYEPWACEFEQRFPGIEVTLPADFSNILSPKIDRELADHKLNVDLTICRTLQDYDRWKKGGALMALPAERLEPDRPKLQGSGRTVCRGCDLRPLVRL